MEVFETIIEFSKIYDFRDYQFLIPPVSPDVKTKIGATSDHTLGCAPALQGLWHRK